MIEFIKDHTDVTGRIVYAKGERIDIIPVPHPTPGYYGVNGNIVNGDCFVSIPKPAEPAPIKKTADRYNDKKPQVSYLLDFKPGIDRLVEYLTGNDGYQINKYYELQRFLEGRNESLFELIATTLAELQRKINPEHLPQDVNSFESLFNCFPDAWNEFCKVCANGAIKYARGNWQNGFPVTGLIDSAMRHMLKLDDGKEFDEETVERNGIEYNFKTRHEAHILWNLLVILYQSVIHPEKDDRFIS